MITLNNVSLPSPTGLSVRVRPQAGTAQYNTLGQLMQDGFKDKRTVEIAWSRMDAVTLRSLASLLTAGGFFSLTYPDPLSGSRTIACRATEQSARVWRYANGAAAWADVTLTLEEQ